MRDFIHMIDSLRRPRLLIQAARHGLPEYSRSRDLKRILRLRETPTPESALNALLEDEDALETTRQAGSPGYDLARHIDVLIAILAEARLLPRGEQSKA